MSLELPILYTFRRCPYAMRARLAVAASAQNVELREIFFRDKAPEFLATSATGTVPLLVLPQGQVVEESFDIMLWALQRNDPLGWLPAGAKDYEAALELVRRCDEEFKPHLDRYKYAVRYENVDPEIERSRASKYLYELENLLTHFAFLAGPRFGFADAGIAPFVRQFAHVDLDWFEGQEWTHLIKWLAGFKASPDFAALMRKYKQWQAGDAPVYFPERVTDAS